MMEIEISDREIKNAVCVSTQALGNSVDRNISDIIYVAPDTFDPSKTPKIAVEIGKINANLQKEGKKYLLIGPGRWGSADRWLGVPVAWADISGVSTIIETVHAKLKAEPSQGSHFFHNITSLGVNYFTVFQEKKDVLDWQWIVSLPKLSKLRHVVHVRLENPLTIKVDGRRFIGIVMRPCHNT